jgi:hypothetical protein
MKLKIFGHYIFFPLVLLGFTELSAVLLACWLATKFAAPLTGLPQFMWGPSTMLAACVFASMAALGLYNKRQRDRLNGTMVRAVLGVSLGGVIARSVAVFWSDVWSPGSTMVGSMVVARGRPTGDRWERLQAPHFDIGLRAVRKSGSSSATPGGPARLQTHWIRCSSR